MQKPIGIYGGTFDPIHLGHLNSALEAQRILDLDSVHFVPCKTPVHKESNVASAKQRYAMLMLATESVPEFKISDCEIVRDGPSYIVDTLTEYRSKYPTQPLCLMLGTDAYMQLSTWNRWQNLPGWIYIRQSKPRPLGPSR